MNEQVNRNRQGLVCGKTENSPGLEPPVKIKNNLNPTNSPGEVTRLGTPVEDNEEPEGCRRRLLQKSFLVQNSNGSDMEIMQRTRQAACITFRDDKTSCHQESVYFELSLNFRFNVRFF